MYQKVKPECKSSGIFRFSAGRSPHGVRAESWRGSWLARIRSASSPPDADLASRTGRRTALPLGSRATHGRPAGGSEIRSERSWKSIDPSLSAQRLCGHPPRGTLLVEERSDEPGG